MADDTCYWLTTRKGEATVAGVYTDRGTAVRWAGKRGGVVRSTGELTADERAAVAKYEAERAEYLAWADAQG